MRDIVSSTAAIAGRAHQRDIRAGDRFVFRIQALKCPLGGIWLQPQRHDRSALREAVWQEIEEAFHEGRVVRGRILNRTPGGFAVGLAGIVGRLDISKSDPQQVQRLGVLQNFVILRIDTHPGRVQIDLAHDGFEYRACLLYTSPSPRD